MRIITVAWTLTTVGLLALSSCTTPSSQVGGPGTRRIEIPYRVVNTAEFVGAQRRNDVVVMRRFLVPTGIEVVPMDPQNNVVCQPPVGTPGWAWIPYSLPKIGLYWGGVCLPMNGTVTLPHVEQN